MHDVIARRGTRNPILSAGSRVPPWAALAVLVFFAAIWVMSDAPEDLDGATRGTWWIGLAFIVLAAIPQRVEVGAEGMRVSWLGTPRLVRYDAVTRAAPVGEEDVFLMLRSGESFRLRSPFFADTDARAVLARIWTVLAAGSEERVTAHERASLARGVRSVSEWTTALAEIAPRGAQYRQAITLERLVAIAANPAAEAELRAAAAVAASSALDDDARSTLVDIAAQAADERLQTALERIAFARSRTDVEQALAAI